MGRSVRRESGFTSPRTFHPRCLLILVFGRSAAQRPSAKRDGQIEEEVELIDSLAEAVGISERSGFGLMPKFNAEVEPVQPLLWQQEGRPETELPVKACIGVEP